MATGISGRKDSFRTNLAVRVDIEDMTLFYLSIIRPI
jgi:hypothetical protein